jgi:hypothetical protein
VVDQSILISQITDWITLDVLLKKQLITYADIQESIAAARERVPKELYTSAVADILNIMEQTYQAGNYQSPLGPPGT